MVEPPAIIAQYKSYIRGKTGFILALTALLMATLLLSASMGAIRIPFGEVLGLLLNLDRSGPGRIVWDVRMPRIIAAIVAGAGLSISGTVMQSVLRNQLASPYTLGQSSAAAFGAAFAIVFLQAGTSNSSTIIINSPQLVTISAFAFSLLATTTILVLTALTRISAESMVLAGIAIGAMFAAGLTLMQYFADSVQLAHIVSWSFGDLGRADWQVVLITTLVLIPVTLFLFTRSQELNAMDSGDETATGLGINCARLRILVMVSASSLSTVIVSFFGIIAFIGLLGPHIARRVIGGDQRYLLVASPLVGAVILLAADTLAKVIVAPMVLPVGVLTSMLGGPLFIYLLIRKSGR